MNDNKELPIKPYYRRKGKMYFKNYEGVKMSIEHKETGVYTFNGNPFNSTLEVDNCKIKIKIYE